MFKIFNSYTLRIPRLPINFYFDLVNESEDKEGVFDYFNNNIIKEAIFISSPHLYEALVKVSNNADINEKKKEKIRLSFLKYLYRISSRTTPFGLFSGLSLGKISQQKNEVVKINKEGFFRHSRLDIQVCFELISILKKNKDLINRNLFYTNTSFYAINNSLRYLEKKFSNKKVTYQIVEILLDEYLSEILNKAEKGVTKEALIDFLTKSEDIKYEDASNFIDELISNQILISELEITVSGIEPLDHIIFVLEKRTPYLVELEKLKSVKRKLKELDDKSSDSNNIHLYKEIINELTSCGMTTLPKDIFQVDSYFEGNGNILSNRFQKDIEEGLNVLTYFFQDKHNSHSEIEKFQKEFHKRYEDEEIKLMVALDDEIGISYPINLNSGDSNPLLKGLFFGKSSNSDHPTSWNAIDTMLLKKVIESEHKQIDYIRILDSDLALLPKTTKSLSSTFSSLIQIVDIDNQKKVLLPGIMGASAASLLARFAHGNSQINRHVEEIVEKENRAESDKIVAEIVHLDEKRVGNILMRPSFRKNEIPITTRSECAIETTIKLDDIYIRYEEGKLVLFSRDRRKEILPKLTNAHNYAKSNLPIYRFLSDFQYYDKLKNLSFHWGNLNNYFKFFPRVYYKNIILSSSKWKVLVSELEFLSGIADANILKKEFNKWRNEKGIPIYFYLSNGDNKLLICSNNQDALIVFLNEIKKYQSIIIEEFLFDKDSICQNEEKEAYSNEFVISFFNENVG